MGSQSSEEPQPLRVRDREGIGMPCRVRLDIYLVGYGREGEKGKSRERGSEKERETERERQRETHRERDRQTDRRGKGRCGERQKLPLQEGDRKRKRLRLQAERKICLPQRWRGRECKWLVS